MSVFGELYELGKKHAKHTVWVFSDLQQAKFENAKRCLDLCMEDYLELGSPAEMLWYLGDSTEGANYEELLRMTKLQEDAFGALGVPLAYASGNHDYDYADFCRRKEIPDYSMPFYEMVQDHPGWLTTRDCEETWFKFELGNYMVYFFCDHIAHDNSWCSTHNRVRWGREYYPYGQDHWDSVRADMESCEKPHIITAAHCAFPGGNRDTQILGKIQPLPLRTRLHLYGHSHIGEYNCPKERIFSEIQWVDWQDIPQVDVASFENIRGSFCHSVMLQIYEDDTLGLFFRNHDRKEWCSAFFPKSYSVEKPGNYGRRGYLSWAPWDGTERPEDPGAGFGAKE